MADEIQKQEATVMPQYTREQIDLLKSQVAKGATDLELQYFLEFCRSKRLDPFARQVYLIVREWTDKRSGKKVRNATIQTGIDGFRSIANRTGTYAPGDESFEYGDRGALLSATVSARKLVAGAWITFSATAHWEEYNAESNERMWNKMPRVMLAKCAEAKALRKGWPDDLSGIYVDAEMSQAGPTIVDEQRDEAKANGMTAEPKTLPETVPEHFEAMPAIVCKLLPSLNGLADVQLVDLTQNQLTGALGLIQQKAQKATKPSNKAYLLALWQDLQREQERRDHAQTMDEPPPVDEAGAPL